MEAGRGEVGKDAGSSRSRTLGLVGSVERLGEVHGEGGGEHARDAVAALVRPFKKGRARLEEGQAGR